MDANTTDSPGAAYQHPAGAPNPNPSHNRSLVIALAVMAAVVASLATALVMSNKSESTGNAQSVVMSSVKTEQPPPVSKLAAPAPVHVRQAAPPRQAQGIAMAQAEPNTRVSGASAVCSTCGVVESVASVNRQEAPKGIAGTQITPGMAAGTVIGGLLGNQIGHGNGRVAATVIGAAGGAFAGNAVEKNLKNYTVYEMRVRMNDGSYRSFEQRSAVAAGTRVVVDDGKWRVAS